MRPARPAPGDRGPADDVAAYRDETRALIAARLPIAAGLFLALMAVAFGIEWLYYPRRAEALLLFYLAFVAIGAAGSISARFRPQRSVAIALVTSSALAFLVAGYLALVHRSAELTLLAMIGFLTGMVVQFPWGVRGQLAAAAATIAAYLWALSVVGANQGLPVPYGLFALVSHALMTVIGARVLDVYRLAAFREAVQAARHAAESQRANAAKSEFLATVSHELRTPLNIIVGYTDLMLEETFTEPEEKRDALGRIHQQSLQLLDLIQSMLDLNRMEAGGVALDLGDLEVRGAIADVRAGLPASWCRPGVALLWEIDDAGVTIRSDRGKLAVVLRNLIHNACKYTESGSVTVGARVDAARRRVDFSVTDTGQGIDPRELADIFEMFRQGSNGPPRGGGVGLGLYIARRLTEALGGTIGVTSELGHGARFTVSLPVDPSAGPALPREREPEPPAAATSAAAISRDTRPRGALR